jgi:hypothetical protein
MAEVPSRNHHAALTRNLPLRPLNDASDVTRHDPFIRHDPTRLPDVHLRRVNGATGAVGRERMSSNEQQTMPLFDSSPWTNFEIPQSSPFTPAVRERETIHRSSDNDGSGVEKMKGAYPDIPRGLQMSDGVTPGWPGNVRQARQQQQAQEQPNQQQRALMQQSYAKLRIHQQQRQKKSQPVLLPQRQLLSRKVAAHQQTQPQQQQQQLQQQANAGNPAMMAQLQQQQHIMHQRMIQQAAEMGIPPQQIQQMNPQQVQQLLPARQNQQALQNNQQQINAVPSRQMQLRQLQAAQVQQDQQQQALMQQQQQQQQQAQQTQQHALQPTPITPHKSQPMQRYPTIETNGPRSKVPGSSERLWLFCETVSRDETAAEDGRNTSKVKFAMEPHIRNAQVWES